MGGRSGKKVRTKGTQPVARSQQNKAAMRRFYRGVFNTGNVALVDELCAPGFVDHEEFPGLGSGRDGVKRFVTMMRTAFPDVNMEVHDLIATGNQVVARLTMSGTHRGEFMGMPPSNKSFSVATIDIVRFKNGKVIEHWGVTDTAKMMEQLGAIPGSGSM